MFLFDIRPDPVPVAGVAGLVILAIFVLILAAVLIVGFVFLLKVVQRRKGGAAQITGGNISQRSRPNQ
jgi:hypothetical protein